MKNGGVGFKKVFVRSIFGTAFGVFFEKSCILLPSAQDVLVSFTVGVPIYLLIFIFCGTRVVGINIYSEDELYDH